MHSRVSLFSLTGLPSEFGYVALVFTFVLMLAPYLASADFGVVRIPALAPRVTASLRVIGPVAFLFLVSLYLPIVSIRAIEEVPDLAGTWARRVNPPDNLRVTLTQSGKQINAQLSLPAREPYDTIEPIKVTLTGKYISSEGYFEVAANEQGLACNGILYSKLYPMSSDAFALQPFASSGTCPQIQGHPSRQIFRKVAGPLPTPPPEP